MRHNNKKESKRSLWARHSKRYCIQTNMHQEIKENMEWDKQQNTLGQNMRWYGKIWSKIIVQNIQLKHYYRARYEKNLLLVSSVIVPYSSHAAILSTPIAVVLLVHFVQNLKPNPHDLLQPKHCEYLEHCPLVYVAFVSLSSNLA